MMNAVLSNPDHPEYGVATIPFPIIKEDNASLTPYGLLHRADYQPMLTPIQQSQEMEMRMK